MNYKGYDIESELFKVPDEVLESYVQEGHKISEKILAEKFTDSDYSMLLSRTKFIFFYENCSNEDTKSNIVSLLFYNLYDKNFFTDPTSYLLSNELKLNILLKLKNSSSLRYHDVIMISEIMLEDKEKIYRPKVWHLIKDNHNLLTLSLVVNYIDKDYLIMNMENETLKTTTVNFDLENKLENKNQTSRKTKI